LLENQAPHSLIPFGRLTVDSKKLPGLMDPQGTSIPGPSVIELDIVEQIVDFSATLVRSRH
jgi:hypothetical protein